MTTDTAPTTTPALFALDAAGGGALETYHQLRTVKAALGITDLDDTELQLFALVAKHTGLDPFSRQIYAVKRRGKVVHQTGIDGYRTIAERTGQYAGSAEPEFEACDCGEAPKDHPRLARVTVHRIRPDGIRIDQVGVARWHELYAGAGDDGFMWRKMPHNQLSKCAEANGLRKAFPRTYAGVYIEEELAGPATLEESPAGPAPDPRTNSATVSRIAERRRAREAQAAAPPATEPEPEPEPSPAEQFRDAIRIAATRSEARGPANKVAIDAVTAETFAGWDGDLVRRGIAALFGQPAVTKPTAAQVDALRAILDPMTPEERLEEWRALTDGAPA